MSNRGRPRSAPDAPLPNRLRPLREGLGLSLEAAAERIERAGLALTIHTLRRLEVGERELTVPHLRPIARAYGVSVLDLIDDADSPDAGPAGAVPLEWIAGSFGRVDTVTPPGDQAVPAPPGATNPAGLFAIRLADDHAGPAYPAGATIYCRRLPTPARLPIGALIAIAHYAHQQAGAPPRVAEVLVGQLEPSWSGDLLLRILGTPGPGSSAAVTIRRNPAATAGLGFQGPGWSGDTRPMIDYAPQPGDHARILGTVEGAYAPAAIPPLD